MHPNRGLPLPRAETGHDGRNEEESDRDGSHFRQLRPREPDSLSSPPKWRSPRQVFGLSGGPLARLIYRTSLPPVRTGVSRRLSFPITAAGQLRTSRFTFQVYWAPDSLLGPSRWGGHRWRTQDIGVGGRASTGDSLSAVEPALAGLWGVRLKPDLQTGTASSTSNDVCHRRDASAIVDSTLALGTHKENS